MRHKPSESHFLRPDPGLARAQTAIEFLSTYGFVFIVLAVVIAIVVYLGTSAATNIPAQCSGYGGLSCSYSSYYTNLTEGYSLVTVALTNSQSVPVNITAFSVTFGSTTTNGLCTPGLVYPGALSVCAVPLQSTSTLGTLQRGYYSANAMYCNGGIAALAQYNCTQQVTYAGSFMIQVSSASGVVFGVDVSEGPAGSSLPAYNSIVPPLLPANYLPAQSGEWEVNGTGGSASYLFGTEDCSRCAPYNGNTVVFPLSTSILDNDTCVGTVRGPFITEAFTTLYTYASQNEIRVAANNALAVYYKANNALSWNAIFSSGTWTAGGSSSSGGPGLASNTLYGIDAVWYDPCGPGYEAFNLS